VQIITQQNKTPIPISQNMIDLIHPMADKESLPKGIEIEIKRLYWWNGQGISSAIPWQN
jgi:hypothetical protein